MVTKKIAKAPKGWKRIKGATTAPHGYAWYNNGASRFGLKYKSVLVKSKKKY